MFTMEIARLIERCRLGDTDALGELYKAYAQRMRGVCRRYVSNEQDVEDVLHDAFIIIFTSFDRLRDASKAEGWMMSITRNVASKYKDHLDNLPFVPLKEAESLAAPDEESRWRTCCAWWSDCQRGMGRYSVCQSLKECLTRRLPPCWALRPTRLLRSWHGPRRCCGV